MMANIPAPVNGTYPSYSAESYNSSYSVASDNSNSNNNGHQPPQPSSPTNAPSNESKNDIPKDEVGRFFVEQCYKTMSDPEKLYPFYSRRSQFVSGNEAESIPVVVGPKAINKRIKELDFHECKVRVLNIDSEASFENILISVIGEISSRGEPSRRFVQTFVLAEQLNGYYVLNDIFRYLTNEDEEFVSEEVAPAETIAPTEEPAVEIPAESDPTPVEEPAEDPVEDGERMRNILSPLWAGYGGAYYEVRAAILDQWNKSGPVDRKFLEKAVVLFVEFQNRPMESIKDCLEWSDYLEKAGIDPERYFSWVQEQYDLLACKQNEGFVDITLERFSK
ncbi:hypothetical protein V8E54_011621 [Elaphomyces granulatus]